MSAIEQTGRLFEWMYKLPKDSTKRLHCLHVRFVFNIKSYLQDTLPPDHNFGNTMCTSGICRQNNSSRTFPKLCTQNGLISGSIEIPGHLIARCWRRVKQSGVRGLSVSPNCSYTVDGIVVDNIFEVDVSQDIPGEVNIVLCKGDLTPPRSIVSISISQYNNSHCSRDLIQGAHKPRGHMRESEVLQSSG